MDNMNTSCFSLALAAFKSAKSANERIDNLPLPMIFKGTLGTGGTISTLPTASSENEGFVYIVITDGTYAGQSAKAGDTFVSDGSSWVLVPSADEPSPIDDSVTSTALTWSSKKIGDEYNVKSFTYTGANTNPTEISFSEKPKVILSIYAPFDVIDNVPEGMVRLVSPYVVGATQYIATQYNTSDNLGTSVVQVLSKAEFDDVNNKLIITSNNKANAFGKEGIPYTVYYI